MGVVRLWARRQREWLPWTLPVTGLFGLFLAVFLCRVDPDFGWHVEAGRYTLEHGLPRHDIFTYTAVDFPWINHEWLSDVLTAVMVDGAGFWLMAAVFAAVWTAALALAVGRRLWPVWALGFAAVAADVVARPNAWTALGLALLLWMVRRGWRWPIVGLFVVWANLHGGFPIGLVALGLAALKDRRYWAVLGASVLGTLVNPYGPGIYVEIWRTMADPNLRGQIAEWAPLGIGALNGFYIVVFLFAVMALGWRRRELLLPYLTLAGSVWSQRQFPLFVVASLAVVADGYERLVELLKLREGWRRWVLPVMATALAVAPVYKVVTAPSNDLPERGIASLRAEPCRGNLFNDYNFGGHVIWQLPGTKVYIDGRMPSWVHEGRNYMAEWRRVLDDAEYARSEFARYGVGCALLDKRRGRLIRQLVDEGWQVSAKDELAVLLRRAD